MITPLGSRPPTEWTIRRQKRKIAQQTSLDLDLTFPGDLTWALCEMQDQIEELIQDNFELQTQKEKLTRAIHELEKE